MVQIIILNLSFVLLQASTVKFKNKKFLAINQFMNFYFSFIIGKQLPISESINHMRRFLVF